MISQQKFASPNTSSISARTRWTFSSPIWTKQLPLSVRSSRATVRGEDVGREALHRDLGAGELQRHSDGVGEMVDVLGEPRGELAGLVGPGVAEGEVGEAVETDVCHVVRAAGAR
jgi:hypothetical protein